MPGNDVASKYIDNASVVSPDQQMTLGHRNGVDAKGELEISLCSTGVFEGRRTKASDHDSVASEAACPLPLERGAQRFSDGPCAAVIDPHRCVIGTNEGPRPRCLKADESHCRAGIMEFTQHLPGVGMPHAGHTVVTAGNDHGAVGGPVKRLGVTRMLQHVKLRTRFDIPDACSGILGNGGEAGTTWIEGDSKDATLVATQHANDPAGSVALPDTNRGIKMVHHAGQPVAIR